MFRKLAIATVLSVGVTSAMILPATPAAAGILDTLGDAVMGKVGDVLFPGLRGTIAGANNARKVGELSDALSHINFGNAPSAGRPLGKRHR